MLQQHQVQDIHSKVLQLSALISEIETNFTPLVLTSYTDKEIQDIQETLVRIIRALKDVKRYLSS